MMVSDFKSGWGVGWEIKFAGEEGGLWGGRAGLFFLRSPQSPEILLRSQKPL
jgi:hypothetical protein